MMLLLFTVQTYEQKSYINKNFTRYIYYTYIKVEIYEKKKTNIKSTFYPRTKIKTNSNNEPWEHTSRNLQCIEIQISFSSFILLF